MPSIQVDHRGEACRWALEQLPKGLARYGDPKINSVPVERTALTIGDVEWWAYEGKRHYVELKLVDDFINSIKSNHMAEQEMKMVESGNGAVMLIGTVEPHATDSGKVWTRRGLDHKGSEHTFAYSGYINYQIHLQEMGIDVVTVCDYENIGIALAGMYTRSLRPPRGERIIKRKVVSVSPEANAVKALFPNMRLTVKACESIAKVAGVHLGTQWIEDLKQKRGGELLLADLATAMDGVSRDTIKKLFGV